MVGIELVEGEPPFLRLKHPQAMQAIVHQEPPKLKSGSALMANFIDCCLRKKPAERKSTKELLKHQFITSIGSGQR